MCSGASTVPVGLAGELMRSARVRAVRAAATVSAWSWKPSASCTSTNTGSASANRTNLG
jgi:hypothetical protein